MAWEIVKSLIVDNNTYTWDFPTELENAILTTIENNGSPYVSTEITSLVPNHSMHDFNIVDYPFTLHRGSDGSWQGGTSYTIGLGTYSVPVRDTDGVTYTLSTSVSVGASYITNTNGTMVVFFVKNEVTHQAAIISVTSAWYLSGDMNRIHFNGYGTSQGYYEQVYNDLVGAIPVSSTGGGAGSGYIGNSLLSNKKMVGYNVPTSSEESTKTESVEVFSAEPLADTPKAGNGFCRITLVRPIAQKTISFFTDQFNEDLLVEDYSISSYQSIFGNANNEWRPDDLSSYFLTAYNLLVGNSSRRPLTLENGVLRANYAYSRTDGIFWIPIQRTDIAGFENIKVHYEVMLSRAANTGYDAGGMYIGYVDEENVFHTITGLTYAFSETNVWKTVEYGITDSDAPYIDYVGFYCCDGEPNFRNAKILCSEI